jgi:hypothetical protein
MFADRPQSVAGKADIGTIIRVPEQAPAVCGGKSLFRGRSMDTQSGPRDGMWTFPKPLFSRCDRETAEIVEKGVALQEVCGTRCAAEFLKYRMISMDVVVRVLLRPEERRHANPAPRTDTAELVLACDRRY